MKAAIVLDDWKLPIFERHLTQSGYKFQNVGRYPAAGAEAIVLHVETENANALAIVVKAANTEAERTGKQS